MNAIETTNLTKYYGKSRGILNLNLTVEEGDFFGFIGPNGAGKSTTIRTLLGLIQSTSGQGRIFGLDIEANKEQILKETGYLPSEAIFYQGMKARDVLKFSADLRKMDCSREAHELCEQLKLDTSKKVDELSFGNRKKVAIVCALQHNPKLLILDEPTGGLDPLMQKVFFDILRERNSKGATIFLSSHILSEIQNNCSKAAIIREGQLIACGSMETLSKNSAKRVSIVGNVNLDGLEGVKALNHQGENINFLYSGDINQLLNVLAKSNIKDLSLNEPDLDEIFMHYYAEEV